MHKQTDGKITALYCRVAVKTTTGVNLDNQMQKLLCHALKHSLNSFMLYADNGASGNTTERPAMNLLKQDIEAGRVGRILITDYPRLCRDIFALNEFIGWATAQGVQIVCLNHGMAEGEPDCLTGLRIFLQGGVSA
jgi:DNA invertase Pin-like site-specific DNA recombinase